MALRSDLRAQATPDGGIVLRDTTLQAEHRAPDPVALALRGGDAPPDVQLWFAARYLVDDDATRAVIAWEHTEVPAANPLALRMAGDTVWDCHACSACCRTTIPGPVSEAERERILDHRDFLERHFPGAEPADFFEVFPGAAGAAPVWGLKARGDGCVFLNPEGLCRIHQDLGGEVKPAVCQKFPLGLTQTPEALHVWLRDGCESRARAYEPGQGRPLPEHRGWIEHMLALDPPAPIGRLLPVQPDRFWPYALWRRVERRAIAACRAAGDAWSAPLAIRDVVTGIAGALPHRLGVEALAAVDGIVAAPLAGLREERGPIDDAVGRSSLRDFLYELATVAPVLSLRVRDEFPERAKMLEEVDLYRDGAAGAYHELAGRHGWDPLPEPIAAAVAGDAAAAAEVDPATADAAVVRYVRDSWVQRLLSKRWLTERGGALAGIGRGLVEQVIAEYLARLRAARDGRSRAVASDWNRGFASVEQGHLRIGAFDGSFAEALATVCRHLPLLAGDRSEPPLPEGAA